MRLRAEMAHLKKALGSLPLNFTSLSSIILTNGISTSSKVAECCQTTQSHEVCIFKKARGDLIEVNKMLNGSCYYDFL